MDVPDHEVGVALEEAIGGAAAPLIDDRLARRNARVLAGAQALSGGNSAVIFSTGSIIGAVLAPDPGYTVYVTGALMAAGEPYVMPLKAENKWLPDLDAIPNAIAERARKRVP